MVTFQVKKASRRQIQNGMGIEILGRGEKG